MMAFLAHITPVILTYNEAPNIGRVLERLRWAGDIVVVDSLSDDATLEICRGFDNVRTLTRPFTTHAEQWNFALKETSLQTEWVLALDADYMMTPQVLAEIDSLAPGEDVAGYALPFKYAIQGHVLRSGVYPPVTALYRKQGATYLQDGHTQRISVKGRVEHLSNHAIHDDRKSFERWVLSQVKYARLEADKMEAAPPSLRKWLRGRTPFAAFAMGFYCLFVRGGLIEGRPGWLYAFQRAIAEAMISAAYQARRIEPKPVTTSQ